MTPEEHARRWEQLHGVAPSGPVRTWLRLVLLLASPLARWRVAPDALTLLGLLVTAAALWLPAPALLVLLAGLLDGLDGAVAVLRDRVTARGAVLDRLADRAGEVLFGFLLWQAGAPGWTAGLCVVLMLAVELVRQVSGRVGTITVGERPVRVLLTASALIVLPAGFAVLLTGLSAVALVQLVVSLRREEIVA